MSESTPRPWRINKYGSIGAGQFGTEPIVAHIEPLFGRDGDIGDHAANAALIVRAVNAHDDLVAALRRLASMEAFIVSRAMRPEDAELLARIEYAEAALAKAGEP